MTDMDGHTGSDRNHSMQGHGMSPMHDAQRLAAKKLANCPDEACARFEEFYKQALAAALAEAHQAGGDVDPYTIEREIIAMLRARSLGDQEDGTPGNGLGWVPVPRGLAAVPNARARLEAYRTDPEHFVARGTSMLRSGADDPDTVRERRMRWVGLGVASLALLWLLVRAFDGSAAMPATAGEPTVVVAPGAPVVQGDPASESATGAAASPHPALADVHVRGAELLYPTSLEIQPPSAAPLVVRVVPSASELGGTWSPAIAPGTATWLTGSTINPILCLPADAERQLDAIPRGTPIRLRLVSGAMRRYEVLTIERVGRWQTELLSQQRAGLTIIACGSPGDERLVVQAMYRPDDSGVVQPQYVAVELAPFARLQVRTVVREDMPDGTAVVRVDVNVINIGETELALHDLDAQLLVNNQPLRGLARGERGGVLDPRQARIVTFRYVAPEETELTPDAVWRVVTPAGTHAEVTLVVPPLQEAP